MSRLNYLPSIDIDVIGQHFNSWKQSHPEGGMLFMLPEAQHDRIAELQATSRELNMPIVGAVFPALLADKKFHANGILLISFEQMPTCILEGDLPQDEEAVYQCTQQLADQVSSRVAGREQITLFMLFDAMVPNIGTILEKLYLHMADSVHYMGANAGSETFQPMPCLFNENEIIENGVLIMLLAQHTGVALEHGYKAPEHLIAATSTTGNRIISIDWRPAFDVYQERIKEQFDVDITSSNFYQYAVHFPFGIMRADGEVLVRIPVALAEDDSLFCVGEVPENTILTLLEAPAAQSLHTAENLVTQCDDNTQDVLTFYCAGRRMHLGDAADDELEILQQKLGQRNMFGALSLGEIGSSRKGGYPLFHNACLVCSTI